MPEEKEPCLRSYGENPNPCEGEVTPRESASGLTTIWECAKHERETLAKQDEIREGYPNSPIAPPWFDPGFAGESWDYE